MDDNKVIIKFEKNDSIGGYGDRIVGLIAIKLISKLLKRKFYILWNKENIKKYFNYEKYDYELLNIYEKNIKEYKCIDKPFLLKEYLMNSDEILPDKINLFTLNQEISQYLYKNVLFQKENYLSDIFEEYKKLYTETLIPTDYFKEKVSKIISFKKNIIGIQIRCGDFFMPTNKGEKHKHNRNYKKIDEKLLNIRNICKEKYKEEDYNIFFTTDNINLLDKIYKIFGESKIIYNNDTIQHLDRKCINKDISKTFVDNYILSQKTEILFIDKTSNFGRIAALSSVHNNLYHFHDSSLIDKKKILSKVEVVF